MINESMASYNRVGQDKEYLGQLHYSRNFAEPEKNLKQQITYYFLRALVVIQSALRLLKSSAPFFEQYGPMLKQLPNMYKMLKLIQDANEDIVDDKVKNKQEKQETNDERIRQSSPTLFI